MKKPSAVVVVVVLLTLLMTGFPRTARACPMIRPLWFVIDAAEVVVLARVASIESPASEGKGHKAWEGQYGYSVALLEILETWKGEAVRERRVHTLMAPQLSEGQAVIAFLERGETRTQRVRELEWREAEENEDAPREEDPARLAIQAEWDREQDAWHQGQWLSIALSEGFMTIDEADAPVFRKVIERAVKLQAAGAVSDAEMREWLISAAERRATREHGLRGLRPVDLRIGVAREHPQHLEVRLVHGGLTGKSCGETREIIVRQGSRSVVGPGFLELHDEIGLVVHDIDLGDVGEGWRREEAKAVLARRASLCCGDRPLAHLGVRNGPGRLELHRSFDDFPKDGRIGLVDRHDALAQSDGEPLALMPGVVLPVPLRLNRLLGGILLARRVFVLLGLSPFDLAQALSP